MIVDPFTVIAFGVGVAALVLAVKRQRIVGPSPAMPREQELLSRVATLERDIASLQRMLVEKQNEIDRLNERLRSLERTSPPMDEAIKARRVLLVGVGDDAMLQEDLAQLRRVGIQTDVRISRL